MKIQIKYESFVGESIKDVPANKTLDDAVSYCENYFNNGYIGNVHSVSVIVDGVVYVTNEM